MHMTCYTLMCVKFQILAKEKWNHTSLMLEQGVGYQFTAEGQWIDLNLVYGPDGGGSGSNFFLRLFERLRRRPKDNWFALIGATGEDESTTFLIGSSRQITAIQNGELTCYANDVLLAYFNNRGSISLTVERLG